MTRSPGRTLPRVVLGPLAMLLAVAPLAASAAADTVLRRGAMSPLQGEVIAIDDEGVRVKTPLGADQVVPWDRVRDVQASRAFPNLKTRLERAEMLWRARSRVERGDTALAEPLLERLFSESRGRTGETSLVIAEGLLRCRLARGEQAGAVIPALETARLRRAGTTTVSYSNLAPVLDDGTHLSPALPPVLPAGSGLERLRLDLAGFTKPAAGGLDPAGGDPVIRAMAEAYAVALAIGAGGAGGAGVSGGADEVPRPPEGALLPVATEAEAKSVRDHPGVGLLRQVLATAASDPQARAAARQRLASADLRAPWQDAWRRFFLGTSLLREEALESRRRGVVELLHLPARASQSLPWLSGLALDLSARELQREGASAEGAILRRELETLHPYHPLRASSLARVPAASTTTKD